MVSGRSISIGPAAYNEPLHYRQGERVQTKNNSSTDDIDIIRPATGCNLCTDCLIIPIKHDTFLQCWTHVTLVQHWFMSRVCWV